MGILVDDSPRRIQNNLRGAIVLLQQNDLGLWIIFAELHHIAIVRAAKGINGLIFIADHKDIILRSGKLIDQKVLGGVGILKFIDQQIFIVALIFLADFGVIAEQNGSIHQQIVKVAGVVG